MEENDTTAETSDAAAVSEETAATTSDTAAPSEAGTPAAVEGAQPGAAPAEVVAPKERRSRARAAKLAKAGPRAARTPEERQAERAQERKQKAAARRTQRQRARQKARDAGESGRQTPPREHQPSSQKTRQGIVVSDKAGKTITVRIDVARRHRRYSKIVRTSMTLHAHDERGDAHTGDTVVVRESRPLSRTKRWRLVEVLERAK
jgi:small subunit ribosomal protein S17